MASVSLQNVWKSYPAEKTGRVTAVQSFSLEVRDREFVVFVGPSGCGKSTVLRMIAGLEEISEGDIFIGDRKVNDVPPPDRDVAMVFQNYALYPHMTVAENLAFGLKLRKVPLDEIQSRVNDVSVALGIRDYLDRKPKALSGGQRQRVALGRAIVRKPKVFLFDEPLSNLDAKMRVQMRAEISRLHHRLSATMIYVTHDQVEAMTMGDRIVVMKDGVIQQIGAPLEVYNRPVNLFVAGFLGSPAMNFIRGKIVQTTGGIGFKEMAEGSVECLLPVQESASGLVGKEVILGIRPEDIRVLVSEKNNNEDRAFFALVELIEGTGAETNLYLQTGAHSIICRAPLQISSWNQGSWYRFAIETEKIQLFNPETTRRIDFVNTP